MNPKAVRCAHRRSDAKECHRCRRQDCDFCSPREYTREFRTTSHATSMQEARKLADSLRGAASLDPRQRARGGRGNRPLEASLFAVPVPAVRLGFTRISCVKTNCVGGRGAAVSYYFHTHGQNCAHRPTPFLLEAAVQLWNSAGTSIELPGDAYGYDDATVVMKGLITAAKRSGWSYGSPCPAF